jgi:D-alanyl-D-alanine carboxypeptidase
MAPNTNLKTPKLPMILTALITVVIACTACFNAVHAHNPDSGTAATNSAYAPTSLIAPTSLDAQTQAAISAAVTKELAAFGGNQPVPGAVVGIWAPGKGVFQKAYGYSNLTPQTPLALDDKFRIGSNTKTFVITVLLQLVDEKKLSLDDPVSKFDLGVKIPNGENITVRELCQMRSGLLDAYNAPQYDKITFTAQTAFTPQQMIATAVANPPLFLPGTQWNYSNTNYLMLGLIIEAVTHHKIQDEINTRLIVPLHLKNTTFPTTDPDMPAPFTHGFGLDPKKDWTDVTVSLSPTITWAAGVMISDMSDMKTWVHAYVTGSTNSAATQKERLTCLPTGGYQLSFGLGIGCSDGWYGYTGGIPGYNTAAYYLPAQGATIIAFVNSQQEKPDPGVANSIFRDITQILYPNNVAFPTDPNAPAKPTPPTTK